MHAVKTYTLETLGDGTEDGGGAKGRNKRWEVLDRMARLKAGLSDGQKNDWSWFKTTWDAKMLDEHGPHWPMIFSGWMQGVLDTMERESNYFSQFVHDETVRVCSSIAAIAVPGVSGF